MTTPGSGLEVEVVRVDGAATLRLHGRLDGIAARRLHQAVAEAVAAGASHVDLDLQRVSAWDDEGAAALARCRDLAAPAASLHYLVGGGPGQGALLAAFASGAA